MVACYSCHSLCENWKTYHVYYGSESFKVYAPGNYSEYNEKSIAEKVVAEEVYICADCSDRKGSVNMSKYAAELWSAGTSQLAGTKCCFRCYHISKTRFCSHYKYAIPRWVKIFINTDEIEHPIDLGPVRYRIYCKGWKPLSINDVTCSDSLKSQFQMGLYLIKYYKKYRKKLNKVLFQDLFSLSDLVYEIQGYLDSNFKGSKLGLSYYYLIYMPYGKLLESDIYRTYCDKREKIKDWAETLSQ